MPRKCVKNVFLGQATIFPDFLGHFHHFPFFTFFRVSAPYWNHCFLLCLKIPGFPKFKERVPKNTKMTIFTVVFFWMENPKIFNFHRYQIVFWTFWTATSRFPPPPTPARAPQHFFLSHTSYISFTHLYLMISENENAWIALSPVLLCQTLLKRYLKFGVPKNPDGRFETCVVKEILEQMTSRLK